MPVPVFPAFAACREVLGLTVSAAARELGVSASYLWDLEQFIKVYDPSDGVPPFLLTCFNRAAEKQPESSPLRIVASQFADESACREALEYDAGFHHSFMPALDEAFVSRTSGSYGNFFRAWCAWIADRSPEGPGRRYRIFRHQCPVVAFFSQFVWGRAWGRADKRRGRGPDTALQHIHFQASDAPDVLGWLNDEPKVALAQSAPPKPPWLQVFAPLLLYISAISFSMEYGPGGRELTFTLAGYRGDLTWRVSLNYPHKCRIEPAGGGEIDERARFLLAVEGGGAGEPGGADRG